jgi:electron transfer flavoprotein alpha subunit
MIEVLTEKCIGCGACLRACAYDAITLEDKLAVIDVDKCVLCGACVQACAFDAILIRKKSSHQVDKSAYKGIWVFAEQHRGVIAPVVYELLGKGRELADQMGEDLTADLLVSGLEGMSSILIS